MNTIKTLLDWHQEAYQYWLKVQNYNQVAKHFEKSKSQITRIAKAFEWVKKRNDIMKREDEILAGQLDLVVGETRKRAIGHLHQMTAWVKELAAFHETLIKEKREARPEETAQMERLRSAISDFNPKDLRDMTSNLKENVHFNPQSGKVILPEGEGQTPEGKLTFTGPTLIIMGPEKDGKEKKQISLQGPTENQDAKPV